MSISTARLTGKGKATMNKYLRMIKKILLGTCAVFTVLYFLFTLMSGAVGNLHPTLPLRNSAVLLLFALELCLCDLIFEITKIKFFVKVLCHFSATLVSAMISLGVAGYSLGPRTLILVFVFLFVYAIVSPIYILVGKKHKKGVKTEKPSDYVSIFKKD